MSDIDPRITRWLNRFNKLSRLFHEQAVDDAQRFLSNEPMTLRSTRNAFIISKYEPEAYGLTAAQYDAFKNAAYGFGTNEDVFRARFDNLRQWYDRATALAPTTHYMTYALENNQLDVLLFRYEVARDESGAPQAQICADGFSKSISVEMAYPNGSRYEKKVFKTRHLYDEEPIHIERLSVEAGKHFTLFFFDGYAMRGREVMPSNNPAGRPVLAALKNHRS